MFQTTREAIASSNHAQQQSVKELACSRTSPPSTSNEPPLFDYSFLAEAPISEEANNSNEELMKDVVCSNCLFWKKKRIEG